MFLEMAGEYGTLKTDMGKLIDCKVFNAVFNIIYTISRRPVELSIPRPDGSVVSMSDL